MVERPDESAVRQPTSRQSTRVVKRPDQLSARSRWWHAARTAAGHAVPAARHTAAGSSATGHTTTRYAVPAAWQRVPARHAIPARHSIPAVLARHAVLLPAGLLVSAGLAVRVLVRASGAGEREGPHKPVRLARHRHRISVLRDRRHRAGRAFNP